MDARLCSVIRIIGQDETVPGDEHRDGLTADRTGDLTLAVLGPLEADVDGVPVMITGRRRRALIIRLAMARGVVVRAERLAADIAEEEPDQRAVASLRTYVAKLRRGLGDARWRLESTDGGYRLMVDPDRLDVARFEQALIATPSSPDRIEELIAALGLWRGDPLADVAHLSWAQAEAARLDRLRVVAWQQLIDLRLARGEHHQVLADLERLVELDRFNERFRVQLVLALYRSGRSVDALRAQRAGVALLRDELGLSPSPELAALEHAVLTHAGSLNASANVRADGADSVRGDQPRPLPVELRPRSSDPAFVGRADELERIVRCMDGAGTNGAELILVRGEPGVGKSRLVAEAASRAHERGATVFYGRCEEGIDAAFGPLFRALAVPQSTQAGGSAQADDDVAARGRLFDWFADSLSAVAGTAPVVLVLDDVHWASASTLAAVRSVVRSAPGDRPLVVAATVRTVDPPANLDVDDLVGALRRDRRVDLVDIAGLPVGEVEALLRAEDVDDPDSEEVHRATGGNPYFVTELARWSGPGELPTAVRDVLAPRLRRVSSLASDVAGFGASCGIEFDLSVVGAALGVVERMDLIAAAEELVAVGLVVDTGVPTQYRFTHALARRAVLDAASPTRQAERHRRLAEVLEVALPIDGEGVEVVASHYSLAGPAHVMQAAEWRATSGRRALSRFAWEEAVEQLDEALRLAGNGASMEWIGGVRLDLAAAHARLGDAAAARSEVLEAAAVARRAGDHPSLARAALWGALGGRGTSLWRADEMRIALLDEAYERLGDDEPTLRVRVAGELALASYLRHQRARRREVATNAVDLAERLGDAEVVAAGLAASRVRFWRPEEIGSRRRFVDIAEAEAERVGDPWQLADALDARRTDAHELGDRPTFDAAGARLVALAAEHGTAHLRWRAAVVATHAALLDGRLDDVDQLAAAGVQVWGDDIAPDALLAFGSELALARLLQGRTDEAMALMQGLDLGFGELLVADVARTFGLALSGQVADATAGLRRCLVADGTDLPHDSGYLFALALLSETASIVGDAPAAEQLVELLRPHIDLLPVMVGPGLSWNSGAHELGLLELVLGRRNDAVEHIERALAVETAFGAVPAIARTTSARQRLLGT